MGIVTLAAGYLGQGRNLPSPRATFLAMGEDDVAIDYGRFHNNSSRGAGCNDTLPGQPAGCDFQGIAYQQRLVRGSGSLHHFSPPLSLEAIRGCENNAGNAIATPR
jgi:hypothetical protein